MGTYTNSNLAWVGNAVVTEDDMNRIENNIEAAMMKQYNLVSSSPNWAAVTTSFTVVNGTATITFTPQTSRVKLVGRVGLENTTAGNANYFLTFALNGVNTGDATYGEGSDSMNAGLFGGITIERIISGLTPGVSYTLTMQARRQGANQATVRTMYFQAQDF